MDKKHSSRQESAPRRSAGDDEGRLKEKCLSSTAEFSWVVLNSITDQVAVLNRRGIIIAHNEAWLRFGLSHGVRSPADIGPGIDYLEACHNAAKEGSELAQRAINGVQSVLDGESQAFQLEYPCDSPSETRWFLMKAVPLQAPEGGAIISHTDVTRCKVAEEDALKRSRILAAAERLARMGSWEWDFHTNKAFHSDELYRLRGFTPQDPGITSEDFAARIYPEDLPGLLKEIDRAVQDGSSFHYEYRALVFGQTEGFMEMHGEVITDITGKPARVIGVVHDITERKRAELELRKTLEELRQLREQLEQENIYLRNLAQSEGGHAKIIGQSEPVRMMLGLVRKVATADSPVLITGETGTGKELLAQAIHDLSNRGKRVMVKVNCAALPDLLVENELFGREKGAYTGAMTREVGRFELAHESTIFLDEIFELSLDVQGKLLRVLEEGQFERLGSPHTREVDVRVIAATNVDLAAMVEEGRFRSDLFYRLNVFPIRVPALRERREDIPLLVWRFVDEFSQKMGKVIDSIPRKSMELLQSYSWPGNIRELRNLVERAMILSDGPALKIEIPSSGSSEATQPTTLAAMERQQILDVLSRTGWRVAGSGGAAEILGLKRTTLEARMKKLGIRRPQIK